MSDDTERALLMEMLCRYEAAIGTLRTGLAQNDRAKGPYRLSLDRAWAEHSGGFSDLGNWLDLEIEKRIAAAEQAA